MRWGLSLSLSVELADPGLVAEVAATAEQAGWDGVFVWDHLWNRTLVPFADPFVTLAAIAAATTRVRIGPMVVALPRRRPQLVAQATTSLDRLSGGRMVLGLGLGVDSYGEYSAFAEPAADDRARGATLDAGIELLEPMLAGQPVPGAGGRTTTVASVQQPRVPIWIAGRVGRRAGPMRVGRFGLEGLALVGGGSWSPEHVAAALAAGALAAGSVDVALVGGSHPDPDVLAASGVTWCVPEVPPGASGSYALARAAAAPGVASRVVASARRVDRCHDWDVPYDPTDPRSQLSTAGSTASGVPRAAGYREIDASPADEQHPNGSRTWWTRSQAMVIGFTSARPGDDLVVEGIDGEHVVLVLDGAAVRIDHRSGAEVVGEAAVVIVPAGTSTVHVDTAGTVVRLLATTTAPHLAARCANAGEYAEGDGNVAEFVAWPDPPSGDRIRVHRLADHPLEEGRLGRIFRCTTLMVNAFGEDHRPRDPTKLSPHHHDDFEQVSLQLDGDYVHHMRAPWTPDSSTWRDDEHRHCVAPAVVVIPPPLIHTSQSVGEMRHWLIDVFAPPRLDFSQRPGWVLNADEYPMPSA